MGDRNAQKSYDYTEGATPIDIQNALDNQRRSRRDSRHSTFYGENGVGSVFDGPGQAAIPTSVSRMARGNSMGDRRRSMDRRRSLDRRQSGESTRSYARSEDEDAVTDADAESERGREHAAKSPPRHSMFESLSNIFGGRTAESPTRRRSLSRRSSGSRSRAGSEYGLETEEEGEERWGYSSGEEADSDEEGRAGRDSTSEISYGSNPPSPNASLPLLSTDAIFGDEARIDMDIPLEDLDSEPPPGPPSRQNVFVQDEDSHIRFLGYETIPYRQWLWRLGCVLSLGVLSLLGHWFPRLWIRWVSREKAFKDTKNGFVVIETAYRDVALFPIKALEYPYPIATVFPPPPITENGLRPSGTRGSAISTPRTNGTALSDPADEKMEHLLAVDYRYSRYAIDPRSGLFAPVKEWRDPAWANVPAVGGGLVKDIRAQRHILFGANEINIESKPTLALLVEEVIHPFYVFQIASIILWSLDDYYYYAFCIALISALSVSTTLLETKKTIARMREMSRFSCPVTVLVDGAWTERASPELVPGDVVNLTESRLSVVPADLFLLSGDAIVNESMLTGESVPVSKGPVPDVVLAGWRESKDVSSEASKSFLYAGTRVVRIRGALGPDGGMNSPAFALVVRTGFNTTKGALVRSMLFPKPMGFKFYRDSIRFILVLTGIAGLGFCASAVQFVRLGISWQTILLRALDLITVVVPPALPATLSIGTSFAIGRLRKGGIFCISPSRVNVAGKINVCCFDKTGTLTEDGLDILGVRAREAGDADRFGELVSDVHDLPSRDGGDRARFLYALATCHSLKMVDGAPIGDPLDVKMFEFTRWTLEEGNVAGTGIIKGKSGGDRPTALVQTVVRPPGSGGFRLEDALRGNTRHAHFLELGVIRTFEFVSSLRRMSVIVKRLKSSSMEVYVKGAPEVMVEICEKDSFPQDYDDLLSYYTKRGYRVIAIAGKTIEGLSWLKAQKMKREQAESGLRFLGLIIFENKLKPGTAPAIHALREAHLPCRMITGDNALTAVSVARECGLISPAAQVFAPIFIQGNATIPMSKLDWLCMDYPTWKLDDYSLKPLPPPAHIMGESEEVDNHDYALALTGDVFRWMINHAPLETLQRMLVKAQIFARMSPDEKNEVVERLQSLGYTVLMCGDGANDCAALKAADVGLSLSEAEASVAAPFTSRTPDISCVLEVIKEGRAALVTSFSCFKYMALYSLIQFTTITLLYSFASSLGDFQFLYIDLFIIIPVAVTMGRTLPYATLHPKRPTASLVSRKVLASIIGQVVITSAVQFWAFFWVRSQTWYLPPSSDRESSDGKHLNPNNYENTALFLVSCFQYILVAAVFSIGPPYRKPMWTNGLLMLSLVGLSLFNLVVLLAPPHAFSIVLELMRLPFDGRITLLLAVLMNVVASLAFERWGAGAVAEALGWAVNLRRERRRTRDGKAYKIVESGNR